MQGYIEMKNVPRTWMRHWKKWSGYKVYCHDWEKYNIKTEYQIQIEIELPN